MVMDDLERPDLSQLPADVRRYIAALEDEVARLRPKADAGAPEAAPDEPPTTLNVITLTAGGQAKRSPRHLYSRQRRGGMGVFDLETAETDPPIYLTLADESDNLLLFTSDGRAFRVAVSALPAAPVRARGHSLVEHLRLRPHEKIVAALPADADQFVVLASQRGWVRRVRSSYQGKSLIQGTTFHDVKEGGFLVAACWSDGAGDLLLATRLGQGVRFAERQVPARGCLGMRVNVDDEVVAVTAVSANSSVFLLGADGKGALRQMSGLRANKAPGAGGKQLMKTERLVQAVAVEPADDLFIISQLSKIIRFTVAEAPPKEGVVQGVNCIALRNDAATAVMRSAPPSET